MKSDEMLSNLNAQSEKLKTDLVLLEKEFNIKKEQFIKIQGAIEVLTKLEED